MSQLVLLLNNTQEQKFWVKIQGSPFSGTPEELWLLGHWGIAHRFDNNTIILPVTGFGQVSLSVTYCPEKPSSTK